MKFKTLTGSIRGVPNMKKKLVSWEKKSRSKFQYRVKRFLEKYWKHHIVFEEFPIVGTRMSLDFYNANKKIAVEVQGRQHTNYVPHFHGHHKINYINQLKRDQDKNKFCEINDITLIEIYDKDELNEDLFRNFGVEL